MADTQTTTENQNQQIGAPPATDTQSVAPPTFDAWLAGQDDTVKGLLDTHTKGLKSALESERQQRGDLTKQLRDVAAKAEKGSALETALNEATGRLELAERRATFAEDAIKPEIGYRNAKAAFAIAQAEQLFDKRGNPDWASIKAAAPELFGTAVAHGNAGTGTGAPPPGQFDMNQMIRHAAGR